MDRLVRGVLLGGTVGTIISATIILLLMNGLVQCGTFGPEPCLPREALNIESFQLNSPTNVTLEIRNSGTTAVSLFAYYVKDSIGNQYSKTSWSGPVMVPNVLVPANIVIDGSAFVFRPGYTYTITVITSRSSSFMFAITAQ